MSVSRTMLAVKAIEESFTEGRRFERERIAERAEKEAEQAQADGDGSAWSWHDGAYDALRAFAAELRAETAATSPPESRD